MMLMLFYWPWKSLVIQIISVLNNVDTIIRENGNNIAIIMILLHASCFMIFMLDMLLSTFLSCKFHIVDCRIIQIFCYGSIV